MKQYLDQNQSSKPDVSTLKLNFNNSNPDIETLLARKQYYDKDIKQWFLKAFGIHVEFQNILDEWNNYYYKKGIFSSQDYFLNFENEFLSKQLFDWMLAQRDQFQLIIVIFNQFLKTLGSINEMKKLEKNKKRTSSENLYNTVSYCIYIDI